MAERIQHRPLRSALITKLKPEGYDRTPQRQLHAGEEYSYSDKFFTVWEEAPSFCGPLFATVDLALSISQKSFNGRRIVRSALEAFKAEMGSMILISAPTVAQTVHEKIEAGKGNTVKKIETGTRVVNKLLIGVGATVVYSLAYGEFQPWSFGSSRTYSLEGTEESPGDIQNIEDTDKVGGSNGYHPNIDI